MKKTALILLAIFSLTLVPAHTSAASADGICINAINGKLSREQRIYRTVLFGLTPAEKASNGETRYDEEGNPWIKMDKDTWRTQAAGYKNTTWSDAQMDIMVERDTLSPSPIRRGIFETKKVLTSELIPSLTQSMRALKCRVETVCENALAVIPKSGLAPGTKITVQPRGCIPFEVEPIYACQMGAEQDKDGDYAHKASEAIARTYCKKIAAQLLEREADVLRLAVSYDASYRSLLQFSGHFEFFIEEFRASLLLPVRQAVSLLGRLQRIPCFLAQCDE